MADAAASDLRRRSMPPPWRAALVVCARQCGPAGAGAVLLSLLYCIGYFGDAGAPGHNPADPLGWWGWWDQSQYLASARALAAGDLAPGRHWYPLGYAILAAPLIPALPAHAYFVVDLACLLACYGGFVAFARRVGVGIRWSVLLFVLAVAADRRLFAIWCEPWNSSPTAALLWLALAMFAAHVGAAAVSRRRLFAIGLATTAIPLFRPTDGVAAALCVAAVLFHDGIAGRLGWRELFSIAAGGALIAVPYAALHLRIYGPHLPDYVKNSRELGFAFDDVGFKAFVLLAEPRAWFGSGTGLLQRAPWMVLGVAGVAPALLAARSPARWSLGLLALVTAMQAGLYVCYIDLLPTGLWRYHNVHYFKSLLPALALFALLWFRDVFAARRRAAVVSLGVVMAVLCLRIVPVPAGAGARSRLAYFPGIGDTADYFAGGLALRDVRGTLPNITAMRLVPRPGGLAAVALRRRFDGTPTWAPGAAPPGAAVAGAAADAVPLQFSERVGFGWPCVLPPYPCRRAPE